MAPPSHLSAKPAVLSSPVASTAPVVDGPAPKDIDLSRAKEPPPVWTYRTGGGEPVAIGDVVVITEQGDESLSAVAAATGKRVWNLRAPVGVRFGALEKGAGAVYASGFSPVGGTLSRVDPKTGKLVWHIEGWSELALGQDGTGGVVRGSQCESRVINLATGRVASTRFEDSLMEVHSFPLHEGEARQFRSQCRRQTWPMIERSGVTLMARGHSGQETIAGINALGATVFSIGTERSHPRVALIEGDEVVVLLLGRKMEALRVNAVTGAVRFRVELGDEASCTSDKAGYYAEAVRKPKGNSQLFVRGCGQATLLDAQSGARVWSAKIGSDAAFLTGVATLPWDEPRALELYGSRTASARLFDASGKVAKSIALPSDVREVIPVAGGVVTTNNGLDATSFSDETGVRWRLPLRFGNSFLLGERFMVLGSDAAAQVVIEPTTGSAFVIAGCGSGKCVTGSPYAVGRVGELWLTTRSEPDELVAIRPPP